MRYRGFTAALGFTVGMMAMGLSTIAWADGPGCRAEGSPTMGKVSHGMHGQGGMAGHMLRHLMRHKQDLGLTDEQIGKLRALALDYDRAGIRGNAEVMVAERELRALLWDETSDLAAIETKVKEREALEATVRIIGIKAKRNLTGVLTPEQRAKLKALWEQRHQGDRQVMQRAEAPAAGESDQLTDDVIPEMEFSETSGSVAAG